MKHIYILTLVWNTALLGMDDLQPIYTPSNQLNKLVQEKPEDALIACIKGDNLPGTRALITNHGNLLRHCYKHNVLPMHRAAQYGHTKIVEFFIKQDPQLADVTTSEGHHVMHYAAASGCVALIRYLHEINHDYLTVKNKKQHEPVHFAIAYDKLEAVQFFLQHGAITYEMAFKTALIHAPLSFFNKLLPYFIIRVDKRFNTQTQSNNALQSWLKDAACNKKDIKVPLAILNMSSSAENKDKLLDYAIQCDNTSLIKELEKE